MFRLSNEVCRNFVQERLGAQRPIDGRLHLLGLRSCAKSDWNAVTRMPPQKDRYDDVLICFGSHFGIYPCTLDPGLRYDLRPINRRGTAHICDGGPYPYRRGMHRGKPGLVQWGPVLIWRDANRNGRQDPEERPREETGIGINIHRGGWAPVVDAWSAGCVVVPRWEWEPFWGKIEASGQSAFELYVGSAHGLEGLAEVTR